MCVGSLKVAISTKVRNHVYRICLFFKVWVSAVIHATQITEDMQVCKLYYLITFFTANVKVACFAYAFSVSCFVSLLAALGSAELQRWGDEASGRLVEQLWRRRGRSI